MNITDQKKWVKKTSTLSNETPYLLIDKKVVTKRVNEFKGAFHDCDIYYAMKAFGDPGIVDLIDNDIAGYDIASFGEAELLLSKGVLPNRLLFSNPVKSPSDIMALFEKGVRYFAFDSINELTKIAQCAPGAKVYLRLKVSDHGSAFPLSQKFGAESSHAVPLMDTARELGLDPVGITFHVGSQSESLHAWDFAIELCGQVMRRLEKVGIKIDFIDLGGGFPATYVERVPGIKQVARAVKRSVKKNLPYPVKLKAEPGRFIVADAGLMVTTVIGRERRISTPWLFLDAGAFNGFIEPLEMKNWKYPVFSDKGIRSKSLPEYYTLTGPTCDPYDTFGFDMPLPSNLAVGDRVYIGSSGAYTVVYATEFNGFKMPEIVYV